MVDWDLWQTLLAIYRGGTYAQAASSLGLNATTVGRRIKLLEKKIGCPLFERVNNELHPTTRCEELLTHIETAFEELRIAEQSSAASSSGTIWRSLVLTAPPFIVKNLLAPNLSDLVDQHQIQIDLMGTGSNISLSRRETDIALRIEDNLSTLGQDNTQIDAEKLGTLRYAVYCKSSKDPKDLPWAGLKEQYSRTSGTWTMTGLAGKEGFRFRVYQFDALLEMVSSGVAKSMLPCFVANRDDRLKQESDVVLEQPLWMLSHRQDREVLHLESARTWLRNLSLGLIA